MSIPLRFGDAFSGTAEQLIYHATAGELDIRSVPISPAVQQLVETLARLPVRRRMQDAGEDLTSIARVIRLKSTLLLPKDQQEQAQTEILQEEEQERRERDLAAEQALVKAAAHWLGERLVALGGILEVEEQILSLYPETEDEPPFPSLWTLSRKFQWLAYRARMRRQAREHIEQQIVAEQDCSVQEMMAWATERIAGASGAICADAWFSELTTVREKGALFLALLEMARKQPLDLRQSEPFAPIFVTRANTAHESQPSTH